MLGHVDGQLVFYGWKGAVPTRYSRALQLDVVPLPGDRGSGEVVNCVVADFEAASGLVRVESFLLDTPGQQVLVTGSVDLGGRTLDIRLTPILKQNIPGRRVTAAVRIRGPLDDPRITPEPLTTAGLVTQAVIEPALAAMRQWLPGVGGAIDEARRSAGRAIGATGVPGPGDVWLPGVDVSCEKFLAQERVARALADRPAPPGQPARSAPDS
jgi:hypothetical protein